MLVPRNRVRPFVILFPGRSGGTLLATSLDTHPEIRVKTEPMGLLVDGGAATQAEWVRHWYQSPLIGRHQAVGMSTKVADLCDRNQMAQRLQAMDARIIALDRRNAVKLTVSIIRARQLRQTTGRWNRFSPEVNMGPTPIDISEFAARLTETLDRRAETQSFVKVLALPTLEITYEDLHRTFDDTLAAACDFLEVRPRPIAATTFKNTSDDLRDAITNFDALRRHYSDTEFAAMFDEGRVENAPTSATERDR